MKERERESGKRMSKREREGEIVERGRKREKRRARKRK